MAATFAQAEPDEDPRFIVARLGIPIQPVLSPSAPRFDVASDGTILYRFDAGDERSTRENVWLGIAAAILRAHGYPQDAVLVVRMRVALQKARLSASGLYPRPCAAQR